MAEGGTFIERRKEGEFIKLIMYVASLRYHYSYLLILHLSSLVPRPLPRFQCYTQKRGKPLPSFLRVTLKTWEWPGDEANICLLVCDREVNRSLH